jgi:hypothetical protein
MKKQAYVFTVILGAALVLGLGLTGCPTDDDGGDSNPFPGTYLGTGNNANDTLILTDDSWTASFGRGTYIYSGNSATLSQGTTVVGTATLAGKSLTIVITSGNNTGTYLYTKN